MLIRTVATGVALWVATAIVDGIRLIGENAFANTLTLLSVATTFGLANAVLKPVASLFGCVLRPLALGLVVLAVNALLFGLVDWIAGLLRLPFTVDGRWSVFWGAIVVGTVSWATNLLTPDPRLRYVNE